MSIAIDIDRERLAEFCEKWKIREFALFGSVTGEDFGEESDVDVMVAFEEGVDLGLEFVHLKWELEELFGREVDVISRDGLKYGRNELRRKSILDSAEVIYER